LRFGIWDLRFGIWVLRGAEEPLALTGPGERVVLIVDMDPAGKGSKEATAGGVHGVE
jgi:hypothetical protein